MKGKIIPSYFTCSSSTTLSVSLVSGRELLGGYAFPSWDVGHRSSTILHVPKPRGNRDRAVDPKVGDGARCLAAAECSGVTVPPQATKQPHATKQPQATKQPPSSHRPLSSHRPPSALSGRRRGSPPPKEQVHHAKQPDATFSAVDIRKKGFKEPGRDGSEPADRGPQVNEVQAEPASEDLKGG
ncbi:hypothetical protein EYF80_016912 [Liparis tanakae]|uniref:Uncharacterized protein n=1 Tax=Liparis tanakae TaxID=230148 RepID=A0A4Z2I4V4_9TELE|nr:hypothetical protein EYF80_016912 [Liparis tanakae]